MGRSEVLAENPSRGLIARGSMLPKFGYFPGKEN
jgi:hypothetical protein